MTIRSAGVDFRPDLSQFGASFSPRPELCEPFPEALSGGGNGGIRMGLLNIIRRMHKRQSLSIREIARLTGVSRIEAMGRHWFKTHG